ncbi:uncharacterized protein LOC133200430 [Saccostrea echinata]|uniref:uncharacterized protein LOC133200430 n=1 Tax=Saccostrea echinata TaxID=191078 RepID=UPI002A8054D8|nr:uncharacterized protein LOC133200430 [Saccostrea echinata]
MSAVTFFPPKCSTTPNCSEYFKDCCPDYYWNVESQTCKECLAGYGGINCSQACPYPYYGEKCQKECKCEKEWCDISRGCPDVSTETEATLSLNITTVVENHTNPTTGIFTTKDLFSTNDIVLILIEVVGFVDIIMIFTYVVVCIYDRKFNTFNTRELIETTVAFPENNSMYENVQIIFPST